MRRSISQLCDSSLELRRRYARALLLALYVTTAAGIPLPAARSAKSGERFPCESCPCGCDSAEHCWRSCCCHTLAERIDWARENGVRPPEFVIAQARAENINLAWLGGRGAPSTAPKSCCVAHADDTKPRCPHCARHHDKTTGQFVAWQALGCHGQSANWIYTVPTMIVVRLELTDQSPVVAWLRPPSFGFANRIADDLVVPPPERA
jgi:hypothetical protein